MRHQSRERANQQVASDNGLFGDVIDEISRLEEDDYDDTIHVEDNLWTRQQQDVNQPNYAAQNVPNVQISAFRGVKVLFNKHDPVFVSQTASHLDADGKPCFARSWEDLDVAWVRERAEALCFRQCERHPIIKHFSLNGVLVSDTTRLSDLCPSTYVTPELQAHVDEWREASLVELYELQCEQKGLAPNEQVVQTLKQNEVQRVVSQFRLPPNSGLCDARNGATTNTTKGSAKIPLISALSRAKCIQELSLSQNNVGTEYAYGLAALIPPQDKGNLLESLSVSPLANLYALELSGCNIETAGWKRLLPRLVALPQLSKLDLSRNFTIDDGVLPSLVLFLRSSTALRECLLQGCQIGGLSSSSHESAHFGNESLLWPFWIPKTLTQLNLAWNPLRGCFVRELLKSLAKTRQEASHPLRGVDLSLDLSHVACTGYGTHSWNDGMSDGSLVEAAGIVQALEELLLQCASNAPVNGDNKLALGLAGWNEMYLLEADLHSEGWSENSTKAIPVALTKVLLLSPCPLRPLDLSLAQLLPGAEESLLDRKSVV